jgi:hypothetical protein
MDPSSTGETLPPLRTNPAELGRVRSVSMSLNLSGGPIGSALTCALAATAVTHPGSKRSRHANAGATCSMKRAISSFTCACGFSPTLK